MTAPKVPPLQNDRTRLAMLADVTSAVAIMPQRHREALARLAANSPLYGRLSDLDAWFGRQSATAAKCVPRDVALIFVELGFARFSSGTKHRLDLLIVTDRGRCASDALAVIEAYRALRAPKPARVCISATRGAAAPASIHPPLFHPHDRGILEA